MSDLGKAIEFLNKKFGFYYWQVDASDQIYLILLLNPETGYDILDKLNKFGLKYTTSSRVPSVRLSIKVEDVINHIKVESRDDKINDLLK